jgi:RHS repeat-associated protein
MEVKRCALNNESASHNPRRDKVLTPGRATVAPIVFGIKSITVATTKKNRMKTIKSVLCGLLFLCAGRLAAQTPTATITSHTNGQTFTGDGGITVVWNGCSNAEQSGGISINGVGLLGAQQDDGNPCSGYSISKIYSTSWYLDVGENEIAVSVCDSSGCGRDTVIVNYVAPRGTLTVSGKNPGSRVDRAGCLTISAGQDAAFECGDLRAIHPLPATVTMDRARSPTLIYDSRHGSPGALLAADVMYSGDAPTSLRATVVMAGQSNIVKDFIWNSACASQACRIVVPIATTQATGLYPVTLQVDAFNGTTPYASSAVITDTVIVVNRASSPFGLGWWIDGLEKLVTLSATKMLWIGGDGSSRLYSRTGDTTVFTVNPSFDRPDTLKHVVGSATWQRKLGDSAYVEFNSSGEHTKTVNALGWTTTFAYSSGALQSITLPVPSGSGGLRRYNLYYSSSLLDSITAPAASFARIVRVAHDGSSRITSITDPGDSAVMFGYDGSNRMAWRSNKLKDTTYFAYDDAGGLKQSSLSMARTDGSGAITTSFRAAETRSAFDGSDVPTPLAAAYTHIDGPRADVADTTNFLVNKFGAPDTVTNALGQRTRLERANATFPALVTKVIHPNGFETRAFFNARGLPDSTVALNPYGNDSSATTKFTWNSVWNQVDSVVGPAGDRTRAFFRTSRAIPDSMRIGTNVNRRMVFAYTADNQVRSVKEADGGPDSVVYDGVGNAIKTYSPVGRAAGTPYFTEFFKDSIGRDILIRRPLSGSVVDSTRFIYDDADRVAKTIVNGPARPYSFVNVSIAPDTAAVPALERTDSTSYDAEGNLVYKQSISNPDYDAQLSEQMTYDAAGRLKTRRVGNGPDSLVYDSASNVVKAKYRSGSIIAQSYDVLNRIVQRIVPAQDYVSETCGTFYGSGCLMKFPFFPNKGDSLRIPADTAAFAYDSAGNMTSASNRYARVRRGYFLSGALRTDTTAIGIYSSPRTDDEIKGQVYAYDLAGRRKSMAWDMGTTNYSYNDFGGLSQITDPNSNLYRFTYSIQSQLDSLVLGSGVREKRIYDDDGRLVFRKRESDSFSELVMDSLSYDNAAHIVRAWEEGYHRAADQTLMSYDGLGAVLARESANYTGGANTEDFRNDAFGNMVRKLSRRTAGLVNTAPFALAYSVTGALTSWNTVLSSPTNSQYDRDDQLNQSFTNGRLFREKQVIRDPTSGDVELTVGARHYYGADDKLMAVQRYSNRPSGFRDGTWEEYWYDALGRRILTRARRNGGSPYDATTSAPLCQDASGPTCRSFTERVWWDGDQALVEERAAEGTNDVSNSGTIGNIHAVTLDEPLAVISTNPSTETRIITYNWRGQGMSSVFPNGAGADTATSGTARIKWPALSQAQTYLTPSLDAPATDSDPSKWMGTFVQGGQGTTTMLYRRNRYFDANTGRFTQEDPTGIVGGMNQYGFADGDPVNFSDPFGLCSNPLAQGLGSLQCAIEDIVGAIKAGPSLAWNAVTTPSWQRDLAVGLAKVPFTLMGGLEEQAGVGAVRILEQDGGHIVGSFSVAKGEARFVTEMVHRGKDLILRGTHIEGDATLREAYTAARNFGREQGAERVIIEGGRRTTGLRPGRVPRPIILETMK